MKSAAEPLSATRVKLTVEIGFDELKPSVDAAYRKISRQIQVPGFRKGKVPPVVVDQRIGRGPVLDEAVNDALPKLYVQALQENELQPVGQPEVEVTRFADGEEFEFTAEVDVRPDVTVPDYAGLRVEVDPLRVTDDDVEEQLQALRERFGSLTDVDRPAADGDFVTLDLAASQDGTALEDAQATGMSYQVGKGTMLDGLDEALVGLSADQSTTFRTKLVGGALAGQDVDVQVTVQAVQEQQLPDVDDEFAQSASEFDTVDELRADLRERLTRGRRLEQASEARDAVLAKLLSMVEIPLPEALVAEDLEHRRQQIAEQLAYAGVTQEDYLEREGQSAEEFEAELDQRVRESIAARFVLEEIAKTEQVGVTEADLSQHVVRRAQQAGVPPDEYAKHAVDNDHMPSLVDEVVRGKALARLVEKAEVVDTDGAPVELETLQPDGTYAEPAADVDPAASAAADPADPADPADGVAAAAEEPGAAETSDPAEAERHGQHA